MKVRWLVIVLLLLPPVLTAKTRYTARDLVKYAKALDVSKLDPSLPSQRLDDWLQSGPAHLYKVLWELSDCDLKPSASPNYNAPLCVKIRFQRPKAGGWAIIKVGTFREGIAGVPHLDQILIGPSKEGASPYSENLSDIPRLLVEASQLTGGQ